MCLDHRVHTCFLITTTTGIETNRTGRPPSKKNTQTRTESLTDSGDGMASDTASDFEEDGSEDDDFQKVRSAFSAGATSSVPWSRVWERFTLAGS